MAESPTPYRRIRPNWKPITPEAYDPGKHPLAYSGQSILIYQEAQIYRVSWVEKEQKWIGPYGLRFPWLSGSWCPLMEVHARPDILMAWDDIQEKGLKDRAIVLTEAVGWVQARYRKSSQDWVDIFGHSFKSGNTIGWTIALPEFEVSETAQVRGSADPLWR